MHPSLRSLEPACNKRHHAAVSNDSVDKYLIMGKEISMVWSEKGKVTKQSALLGLKN